jgi:hypothetical protein
MEKDTLTKKIKNLEKNKSIKIDIDTEVSNTFKHLTLKKNSLESIVNNCIVDNSDVINKINLEKILTKYVQNDIKYDDYVKKTLINYLGKENYFLMYDLNLQWEIDWTFDKLIITNNDSQCNISCTT